MLCGRALVCVRCVVLLHSHDATSGISHGAMDGSNEHMGGILCDHMSGSHGVKDGSPYCTKGSSTYGIKWLHSDHDLNSYDCHNHSIELVIFIIYGTLTFCKEMREAGGDWWWSRCASGVSVCFCVFVFLRFYLLILFRRSGSVGDAVSCSGGI
jgi:hypothetical protein